ncbi:MAG: hypothetical protein R2836_00910 [Chitinophagales bacterium]
MSGLPAGLSSFSTNNQNPAYTSTLTIGNTAAVAVGTYNFTLNATGSTGTEAINLSLTLVDNLSGTVNLTSPANTATGVSVPTNFTWSSVSGSILYHNYCYRCGIKQCGRLCNRIKHCS